MKKYREYLETLAEPFKSEALRLVLNPESEAKSLSSAVLYGFCWPDSVISAEAWHELHSELRFKETGVRETKVPVIPELPTIKKSVLRKFVNEDMFLTAAAKIRFINHFNL